MRSGSGLGMPGASLKAPLTKCIRDHWAGTGSHSGSGGGSSAATFYDWEYAVTTLVDTGTAPGAGEGIPLSPTVLPTSVGIQMANFRASLTAMLKGQGIAPHGTGMTGLPTAPKGFHLEYTSSGEEGVIWAVAVPGAKGHSTVLVVWHTVNR